MSAFNIIESDDGLSYRVEWDMHYITDEQVDAVRAYIESLQAENAELRKLVRDMWRDGMCECDERGACAECEYGYLDRMHELGVDA